MIYPLNSRVMKKFFAIIFIIAALIGFSEEILNLEHATSQKQISWGLMQRKHLAPNNGMLFHFGKPRYAKMWSFNCFIDLSIAFLDENGRILEIHELKAYPEMMDPKRPVYSLKDIKKYHYDDPICRFFRNKGVSSSLPASYALEVNAGWFEKNNINVGDKIFRKN